MEYYKVQHIVKFYNYLKMPFKNLLDKVKKNIMFDPLLLNPFNRISQRQNTTAVSYQLSDFLVSVNGNKVGKSQVSAAMQCAVIDNSCGCHTAHSSSVVSDFIYSLKNIMCSAPWINQPHPCALMLLCTVQLHYTFKCTTLTKLNHKIKIPSSLPEV